MLVSSQRREPRRPKTIVHRLLPGQERSVSEPLSCFSPAELTSILSASKKKSKKRPSLDGEPAEDDTALSDIDLRGPGPFVDPGGMQMDEYDHYQPDYPGNDEGPIPYGGYAPEGEDFHEFLVPLKANDTTLGPDGDEDEDEIEFGRRGEIGSEGRKSSVNPWDSAVRSRTGVARDESIFSGLGTSFCTAPSALIPVLTLLGLRQATKAGCEPRLRTELAVSLSFQTNSTVI